MKKIIINTLLLHLTIFTTNLFAQTDSTKKLTWSAYIDTYYAFNSQNTPDHTMPSFLYSYNRNKEFNINIATIEAKYNEESIRASLALMTGTYAISNLASEPALFRNVYEANIGVKLSKTKNLWVDIGVLPSHIGFEGAKGMYNWTATPTILADNTPYYETGLRLSYTSDNGEWYAAGFALNGWQRIQRIDGNSSMGLGHQLTYTKNKWILNSSSFVGNVYPDSVRKMRYFHNFFARYQATSKLGINVGFDLGTEQKTTQSNTYNTWWAGSLITKYQFTEKWSATARYQFFRDKNSVIIPTNNNGFLVDGYSVNLDYQVRKNVLWRLEAQNIQAKSPIFVANNGNIKNNLSVTTTLAIQL